MQPTSRLLAPWALVLALASASCEREGVAPPGFASANPDTVADAYAGSVAALVWPGATRACQVTADGDLFNGAWFVRIEPSAGGLPAARPARIAFEERWRPVAHWTRTDGALRWDFEAVAAPEPEPAWWSARGALARWLAGQRRHDDERAAERAVAGLPPERVTALLLRAPRPLGRDPVDRRNLFVRCRATVTNTGARATDARLVLRCEPAGPQRPYFDPDSLVATPWTHVWRAGHDGDSLLALADGRAEGRALERGWTLEAGEHASFDFVLPAYPTPAHELAREARVPHERRVAFVREYWARETARGATFDLPDRELANALRGARALLLATRERRDVDWVPLGGPFHYREVWLRDGARVAEALAVCGYTRESRELARAFLRFRSPSGAFVSQQGQLDGTGQALWAFEQTLLRPSPAPELRAFVPAAREAWRALERQRALTSPPREGWRPGVMPPTDPHDAELVRAQLVGNDAWSLVGERAAARLLRAAGDAAGAAAIERDRARYLGAFHAALEASGPDVPASWQGVGIDWGNLNVGYPCEVLEPHSPRLAALAARYWAPVGGPGLGYYRNPDSLHTYVAADFATVAMLAGDREAAERILDATLRWRTASGGAAECFVGSQRAFGHNFPPHPTAAAALLCMTRNALVFDDADTLMLALGARASWWRGTRVTAAPTRWGLVDLAFAREDGAASFSWTAVPVWTLLTLPPGTRPASIDAPLRPASRPDQLLAPPGTAHARVRLRTEPAT